VRVGAGQLTGARNVPQLLGSEGAEALLARLREEAASKLPPFLRSQTKYSYYFAWMAGRIASRFPELDEASADKLLLMDSGQLDVLLENANVDAAALLEAADKGLTWDAYHRLATHQAVPGLLGQ